VLATHFIRQFPLHFPSRASPCAITFQPDSTWNYGVYSRRLEPTTHLHMVPRLRIIGIYTFPPTTYLHDVLRDNSLPCVLIYSQSARADNLHGFEDCGFFFLFFFSGSSVLSSPMIMSVGSVSVKEHPFIVFSPFSQMFSRQV